MCSCKLSISCKLLALYVNCVKEDDFSGSIVVREVKVWGMPVIVIVIKASDSTKGSLILLGEFQGCWILGVFNC